MNILIVDSDHKGRKKLVRMIKKVKNGSDVFVAGYDESGYEAADRRSK